jgi:hypothetical protein
VTPAAQNPVPILKGVVLIPATENPPKSPFKKGGLQRYSSFALPFKKGGLQRDSSFALPFFKGEPEGIFGFEDRPAPIKVFRRD